MTAEWLGKKLDELIETVREADRNPFTDAGEKLEHEIDRLRDEILNAVGEDYGLAED